MKATVKEGRERSVFSVEARLSIQCLSVSLMSITAEESSTSLCSGCADRAGQGRAEQNARGVKRCLGGQRRVNKVFCIRLIWAVIGWPGSHGQQTSDGPPDGLVMHAVCRLNAR